jgi:hypothetical protein
MQPQNGSLNGYNINYSWNILPHNNPDRCTQIVMVPFAGNEFLTYTYVHTNTHTEVSKLWQSTHAIMKNGLRLLFST